MIQLANNLLPLLISLSPLESEDQMLALVLEAMNSALTGTKVRFVPGGHGLDLIVDGQTLGAFELEGAPLQEDTQSLFRLAVAVLGVFMGQQRHERALRAEKQRTEAKYRQLAESVPVGLFESDVNGRCTYVNQQWSDISGYPTEVATGAMWNQCVHPADLPRLLERAEQCIAEGVGLDERFRMVRPDGGVRHVWVTMAARHGEDGAVSGFTGAVVDITPGREAEAALEKNEERLRLTLEAVEVAVVEYNRATGETYFSPRFYQMLGYEPGEFPASKESFWTLAHPDDRMSALAGLHASYSSQGLFTMEGRLRSRSGAYRWIRGRGRVLTRGPNGEVARLLGTAVDVTDQREAEDELRLILATCFDGFVVVDSDRRIAEVNEAYCRLTGYGREELLMMSVPDLDVFDTPDTARELMEEVRAKGWKRFETGHRRKDGTVAPLEVNVSWSPLKGGRCICFVRDLSARNVILQKLSESEMKYRALIDNQAGVVFTASMDGLVQFVSPQTERLFNCTPSSLIGRRWIEIVEPSHRNAVRRLWNRAMAGAAGEPVEAQFRFVPGGERHWVAISMSPQRDPDGETTSMLGTIWDLTERREAEESLQRSEEQFRSVWESSADGMRLSDGDGTILRVNESFCRLFSMTREQAEGRTIRDCYGPADRDWILESYRSKYPNNIVRIFESKVELWNGTQAWLEVSSSLIQRPGGPIVLSIFRDIMERKATEAQLSVLARAIEQSPASVVVTDTQGRIEYVNPKFTAITGYSAEEAIGENPRILKSAMNQDVIYDDLWRTITDGRVWQGEMLNRRRDGSLFWEQASISPVKNASGKVTHYVAVKEDITERKRVRQALEESERRFREMLEHVDLLALLFDHEGRVTFCNDYLCRLTGWSREELMGANWFDLLIPANIRDEIRKGFAPHQENEILTADGQRLLIAWDNTPLRGPSGELAGTASLGRNITSERILEEQYRQAQKLESLGRLAGGVAHDFNNLLTVINGYAVMMMEQFHPLDPMHIKTREILRAGLRAADLTKQLLAFSRKQVIERKVIQLNDLLAETKRMLQRIIGEHIRLEVETNAGLGCVEADAGQIHQILMNLAVNARDAMPKGGVLYIKTAPLEVPEDGSTDWDLPPGRYAQLIVSDTGMGMDPETQRHAFEPFFTTKEVDKGTGLGLATVYGVVKQHGGGIQLESRSGEGTSFRLAFPVCDGPASTAAGAPAEYAAGGTESVLLVEDQVEVRRLAAAILRTFGYQVHEAADGREALKLADEIHFDLLLSDMMMPNMGGYELAQELMRRQHPPRILLMSGYAEHENGDSPESLGASFISKPFSPQGLAERVREVLDA